MVVWAATRNETKRAISPRFSYFGGCVSHQGNPDWLRSWAIAIENKTGWD
jgi:hypothetical protein